MRQRIVSDRLVTPDLVQQLFLGYQAAASRYQVAKHIKNLRPKLQIDVMSIQPSPVEVERELSELVAAAVWCIGLTRLAHSYVLLF